MAEVSADVVKKFRAKTGLPLMDCKKALMECNGDEAAAEQWLRERGVKVMGGRLDRETGFGRFGIFAKLDQPAGAMVELKCESDPVAKNEEFVQLAADLAQQLALGPGAKTGDELLDQPSPSKKGMTLRQQRDELMNRIREVFNVGRMHRFEGPTGGYSHNSGTISGVLLSVSGGTTEAAKDVSMHVAAMRPACLTKEQLPADEVDRERSILREAALKEGKPANIVDKMVEGRLRGFFAEKVLLEQPFVKDDTISVGKFSEQNKMQVKDFIHWELGKG
jgi:elongation factor Ts